ncbi:hypothetical protein [Nocardioides ginsengisoli]|uniref:hypothetical protein n=1 Tax=Nocardioides ginsengisoli TaxID=363868 RepID=UPI00349EF8D5
MIVVGSQSILGTYDESELPAAATMSIEVDRGRSRSIEVDILPIADSDEETDRLADLIEGVAGEFSPFDLIAARLRILQASHPVQAARALGWLGAT